MVVYRCFKATNSTIAKQCSQSIVKCGIVTKDMAVTPEFLEYAEFAAIQNHINIQSIMGAVALAAVVGRAAAIVPQSDVGIRMRSGRPMLKKEYREFKKLPEEELETLSDNTPGGIYNIQNRRLIWMLPFDHVVKVNVADRTSDPRPFKMESQDKVQFEVNAAYTWFVRRDGDNPFRARFKVNNEKDNKDKDKDRELEQTVVSICNSGLRKVLSGSFADNFMSIDDEYVDLNTREECKEPLLKYGVSLKAVRLESVARTDAQVLAQAMGDNKDPRNAALMAAMILAERQGTRIPLKSIPGGLDTPPAA